MNRRNGGAWVNGPGAVIAKYVLLSFYGYFTIGLTLAVLPVFIHQRLGFNAVVAGGVVSIQYVMTFFMRAYAGHIVDSKGPRPAVILSMFCFMAAGISLCLAFMWANTPLLSLTLLMVSRLFTGCGEGMVGASPVNWAILHAGEQHTAMAISYNGIATYSAMAIGAPLGLLLANGLGYWSLGVLTIITGIAGWWLAITKKALRGAQDAPKIAFLKVLKMVTPYGTGLALAGIGFGAISTFITLYFIYKSWVNPAICITGFSLFFILGRIFFSRSISTYGGLTVAIASMVVECIGLIVLCIAGNHYLAIAGASITGLGFSLIFPALGYEAIKGVSASNKGAALGAYGLFIDISLGITGPLIGFVANHFGLNYIYPFSASVVLAGLLICYLIKRAAVREFAQ